MRRYETIVILDPDLSEEERDSIFARTEGIISRMDGLLVELSRWGGRKLAYEIRKKTRGYYVRYDYCGLGPLVAEIERTFQIDDRVLKYMTILLEEKVDVEKVKEEIAKLEAEAAEKAAATTAAEKEAADKAAAEEEAKQTEEPAEETAEATETTEPESEKEE